MTCNNRAVVGFEFLNLFFYDCLRGRDSETENSKRTDYGTEKTKTSVIRNVWYLSGYHWLHIYSQKAKGALDP